MTKKQLLKFIKIRNSSEFNSNLQFSFDLDTAGIKLKDLGKAEKDYMGRWTWKLPFGLLVENMSGFMSLE